MLSLSYIHSAVIHWFSPFDLKDQEILAYSANYHLKSKILNTIRTCNTRVIGFTQYGHPICALLLLASHLSPTEIVKRTMNRFHAQKSCQLSQSSELCTSYFKAIKVQVSEFTFFMVWSTFFKVFILKTRLKRIKSDIVKKPLKLEGKQY